MKALVTGGSGFIGGHVVDRLLAEGHSVRLFKRKATAPEQFHGKNIELYQGDLEDTQSVMKAMTGADIFFHIGEIKNITRSAAEKNVALVEQIVRTLADEGVRRFIFISSITVAGIPSSVPADEDTKAAVTLRDQYTTYKRRCEEILREHMHGCEYAVIRPAPVYGLGSRYLGKMVNAMEVLGPIGLPFIGDARNMAPLIHVKDLAAAICRAGSEPAASGQTFNITDGLSHTWFDFFHEIADALGKKLRIIPLPSLLLKLVGAPLDMFSGFLGFDLDPMHYIEYFSKNLMFSNKKAKTLLNWQPDYALFDGVREMVAYYRR